MVLEFGTVPPLRLRVTMSFVAGVPMQVPFRKSVYVTVPVGVNPATPPPTTAVS